MLDQFIRGSVSRLSPEAPVPVVQVSSETHAPGGAGNVARNLAALGARAKAVGVIGDDAAGARLASDLTSQGVDSGRLLVDGRRVTSQKCRIIAEHQQVVRFDRETVIPPSPETQRELLARLEDAAAGSDAIVLSDYGKGVVSQALFRAAVGIARRRRIPITVDPKIENFRRYRGVTCLTPNFHEAWAGMHLTPRPGLEPLEDLGRGIVRALRCRALVITRGPEGMSLFRDGARPLHIPTQAREVYDVTGAGDTVIAVLTLGLACGADPESAARLANCAAGIVVGKLGTASVEPAELKRAL